MPEANKPRSATRSKSRSPAAATPKTKRTYTRRSPNTRLRALLQEVEDLFAKSCGTAAPKTAAPKSAAPKSAKSQAVPTLVPYAGPAGANPFNSPPKPNAPATMVPMTLGNAFAKPATKVATKVASKAKTPKVADASAAPVSKRKGVARPEQSRTVVGSYQWFIDDWKSKNPDLAAGKTRPQLMALPEMKRNYKIYKNSKGAPAAAAGPLSMVGEAEEAEEDEEDEEKVKRENNLGLL